MIYLWITISQLFVCLPFLELTTFEQQVCSTKIGYANALLLGINSFKKETWPLCTAHIKQNSGEASIRTTTVRFTQLLLNLVNLRDLFGVRKKLKESIFKNNNQISSTLTTRTWVLPAEWIRTWRSTVLVPKWKNVGGPRLFQ